MYIDLVNDPLIAGFQATSLDGDEVVRLLNACLRDQHNMVSLLAEAIVHCCRASFAILANSGSEGLSVELLHGYSVCLATKCAFEWLVWERHSLTIVTLQLTHNSCQDKTRLNHALMCRSERLL